MPRPDWVEVGRIARPHGIRGEVRVSPDTDNPERFGPGSRLFARSQRDASLPRRELEIEYVRGDESFPIIAFRDLQDRDEAELIKGWVLEVPADELPALEEGEFYPWELEGLAVFTESGRRVGEVVELMESPANDVLRIRLEAGSELLVPFVMEVVPEVLLEEGRLVLSEAVLPEEG